MWMGKEKPKSGLKSRFLIRAFAVPGRAPSARERHLGEGAGDDAGMRRTEAAGANQGAFKVPRHAAARGCGLFRAPSRCRGTLPPVVAASGKGGTACG